MAEYDILPSPLRNINRLNQGLNPAKSVNYTAFIPPSITGEQYIIEDRSIGVSIGTVQILDGADGSIGSIAVLGSGRLIVL